MDRNGKKDLEREALELLLYLLVLPVTHAQPPELATITGSDYEGKSAHRCFSRMLLRHLSMSD